MACFAQGENSATPVKARSALCWQQDWMRDLTLWLNNEGTANDGLHRSVGNLIWWDWNANSGDTGGLLDDAWTKVIWPKVQALTQVGLRPWYILS